MNPYFNEINEKFGFGCMRLPLLNDGEVDYAQFSKMIDAYFAAGFNYFDTAHGYHQGKSEIALRECLTSKYPRDRYILTNKLTNFFFHSEEEIDPFFANQLEWCGVDYFDFYLMHAQGKENFAHFKKCHAYEHALKFLAEGKIRHFGISFHDSAEVLEQILTEYPQIEVVQIQLNYMDYEDPAVQARKVLEVCEKHGKPAIVMEPIKGGSLINLPEAAQQVLDDLHGGSNASYALRFAAGFESVMMVLSGMSTFEQLQDNVSCMKNFTPLSGAELEAVNKVAAILREQDIIPCTTCRYCIAGCPQQIAIPDLFACANTKKIFNDWNQDYYYNVVYTGPGRKASDCIKCGACEKACPQHLEIRDLLAEVAQIFEKR